MRRDSASGREGTFYQRLNISRRSDEPRFGPDGHPDVKPRPPWPRLVSNRLSDSAARPRDCRGERDSGAAGSLGGALRGQECTPEALRGGFAVLLHKIEADKRNPPICLSCFFLYLFGLLLLHKINRGGWRIRGKRSRTQLLVYRKWGISPRQCFCTWIKV